MIQRPALAAILSDPKPRAAARQAPAAAGTVAAPAVARPQRGLDAAQAGGGEGARVGGRARAARPAHPREGGVGGGGGAARERAGVVRAVVARQAPRRAGCVQRVPRGAQVAVPAAFLLGRWVSGGEGRGGGAYGAGLHAAGFAVDHG